MAQSIVVKSKEIRVKNPEMVIEDENKAEIIEFSIFNANAIEGVKYMAFYVQYRNKLGEVGMDVLQNAYPTEIVHNDMLVLDWLPSATFTKERGKVEIQIIGFTESLVVTSDTKYQSGKMYFSDSNGTFLPVYPADSEHTPKVGGDITGTVYENQVTGDDHRWSTEKCQLVLPENIYDNGTPVYSEAQVKNLITQMNAQVALADADALKSEGYAIGKQNGVDVGSESEYYNNNAKFFKEQAKDHQDNAYAYKQDAEAARDKAEDWAIKTNGKIDNIDYSAKYYANEAKTAVEPIEPYIDEIVAVGTNIQDVTDVADALDDISTVKANLTDIGKVADIDSDVSKVADIDSDVSDVASIKSDVSDVASIKEDVSDVASIKSDVSDVADIKSAVSSVAAIAEDVSAVNDNKTNIDTVASNISDIGDVATDLNDEDSAIKAVATDIENVNDVADDLANIDAVAADLTNIDAAEANALKSEGWANGTQNGTPVSSDSPYYHANAKYWADAVPNLNDAIAQHEARIENLEEAHGSYHEVDVKSVYTIPSGKGDNWLWDKAKGVQRAKNQVIDPTAHTNASSVGIIQNNLDGTFSIIGSSPYTDYLIFDTTDPIIGHTYLFAYKLSKSVTIGTDGFLCGFNSGGYARYDSPNGVVFTENTSEHFALRVAGGYDASGLVVTPILVDLTVYFNGTIPSDADTIAKIQTNYPWLLTPSAYDAGSEVNSVYEGIKSIGVNIFDEVMEVGKINDDGTEGYANDRLRSKNYIPVKSGESYYVKCSVYGTMWWYDVNKNCLGYTNGAWSAGGGTITAMAGACFGRFSIAPAYGTTYNHDIQICLNSYSDKTTYHPYMKRTLLLSTPVPLKSAGAVAEELDIETGYKTRPLGSYTFTGEEEWVNYGGDGVTFYIEGVLPALYSQTSKVFCAGFLGMDGESGSAYSGQSQIMWLCSTPTYPRLHVRIASGENIVTKTTGKTVIYPLATPDSPVSVCDPIINNWIKTEAGGSIESILTNPVDDSMTLGYINL